MRYRRPSAALIGTAILAAACSPGGGDGDGPYAEEGVQPLNGGEPEVVAAGLEVPWGIGFLPGGDALVAERDSARVLRITPGAAAEEVGSIGGVDSEGEGGLLGLAVSPEFSSDSMVYLYYTAQDANRVVRVQYDPGLGLGEPEVVLDGIPSAGHHNGGRIAFGPDGLLYVGTGDAGSAGLAQDTGSLAGKILRMTPDGEPAPDNPFGNRVYSYGHRNVQGLAWDAERLFAVEFGPDADDEVNLIEPGGNYGWPEATGAAEGSIDPVVTWEDVSTASPSGAAVTGGSLWVAALQGERLWRTTLAGGEPAGEPQSLYTGDFGRLRTVAATPEGNALWVATSNRDGRGEPADDDDRILRIPLR